MNHSRVTRACALLSVALLLAVPACKREQPPRDPAATPTTDAGDAQTISAEPVVLEDVLEITPRYVIGISYPDSDVRHPALAKQMKQFAEAARSDFQEAVESRNEGGGKDGMLYDLSLTFTRIVDTPHLVVYGADGSSFTGGAHGVPLLARFVWLPWQGKRLQADELVPADSGWEAVAAYVREELHGALSQRVDADELAPGERTEMVKSAGRMIDEGTAPDPDNYRNFEPVVNAAGRITALRFVFPPYQVGPYADGIHTVEVPASVLLPHVAPEYRELFAGG